MPQPELLKRLADVLGREQVAYMLTGSWASSLYGAPRTTHDIDVIVDLRYEHVQAIEAAFPPPEFYFDAQSAREAIQTATNFNIIEPSSADKIDFWMVKDTVFDEVRFGRRVRHMLLGNDVWITTPEDTILQKLRWAKELGGSQKQFIDALRVYEVQRAHPDDPGAVEGALPLGLDEAYMDLWAARLGVAADLALIRAQAV